MSKGQPRGAWHNLSHSFKYSDYLGYLTPVACFDVVPGDNINHKVSALIRTQPLLAPIMHVVDIDLHAYFVPDRLVFEEYEDFQTGGLDGQASVTRPTMAAPPSTGYAVGSLADYYGLPTGIPNYVHDARPIRGYNCIINRYYLDTQLQTERVFSMASGLDTTTDRAIFRPAWKRDYFTKCRPEPQLGDEVVIPLTGDADIVSTGLAVQMRGPASALTNITTSSTATMVLNPPASSPSVNFGTAGTSVTSLEADLSSVTGIPVRELRESNAVQRWQESNNIFGGRYMEQIMARFGIFPEDSRMQWPETLGMGDTKIQFSEVLGTTNNTDTNVGEMGGHGISVMGSNRYRYKVKEHGFIHVFMIMRPKTQYFQGLHRMWNRETRFDYLLPEFVAVGDQAVKNKELYVNSAAPDGVFGYTPIYEEYRTIPSRVAGEMKTSLKYWHMAREFSSEPALNSDFIKCNPTNRVWIDQAAAQVYVNMKHDISAYRLIPKTPDYRLM